MSEMTVTQMSITETTDSPQHKLHWLAEQALSWSELPVITVRPTVFLEGFFLLFAAASVRDADELALPMGASKTSPVASVDVYPEQQKEAIRRRARGATLQEFARSYNVSRATISRLTAAQLDCRAPRQRAI
jgi:hypothetical protein